MPFLAHFNQSKPVVTSLSQICGHFLLVTEFPLAEYPCNLGKLHFATENATDSGRGVFENLNVHSLLILKRGRVKKA